MDSIPYLTGWEDSAGMIKEEARQLAEEGRDPEWIAALLHQSSGHVSDAELFKQLQAAPDLAGFPYDEPSALEEIRRRRPAVVTRRWDANFSDDALQDRMLGAWLGRCCGCALGKPVELFMDSKDGATSRERVRRYLLGSGPSAYPLNDYFTSRVPNPEKLESLICPTSWRENIAYMESDDDIRYTVLGQYVLHHGGADFTTLDVMHSWMTQLHYSQVCTAETQAFRNFVLRYRSHLARSTDVEVDWTWVATHQNPYREWIGAQIRADSWGYAAPGNPELAAEFAWRDARMSHVKNGIYGEMFVAAMIAAAFVLDDPLAVVRAGLAEIPQSSRLHAAIEKTIDLCHHQSDQAETFESVFDGLDKLFGHYGPVHTINNAALVVAALLLGGHDYEKVITIAVMGGWDTDCNGATVGSIFGAMHGARVLPSKWTTPLHDTLYAEVQDYNPIAISECARRSCEIARKIQRSPQR